MYDRKDNYKYTAGIDAFKVEEDMSVFDQSMSFSSYLGVMVNDPTRNVTIIPTRSEHEQDYSDIFNSFDKYKKAKNNLSTNKKTVWYSDVCMRIGRSFKDIMKKEQ